MTENVKLSSEVVYDVKDLNLWYGKDQALKNINMQINRNKVTAIIGPSGCGKSTLAGFITRSLSRKDYHIGYIHFPTYLMDLKN